MQTELTGLTLEAAEAVLRESGINYTLRRTETPFHHQPTQGKYYKNYIVRFDGGELTYASFPVLSIAEELQEGRK